jgi:hypothetical protein
MKTEEKFKKEIGNNIPCASLKNINDSSRLCYKIYLEDSIEMLKIIYQSIENNEKNDYTAIFKEADEGLRDKIKSYTLLQEKEEQPKEKVSEMELMRKGFEAANEEEYYYDKSGISTGHYIRWSTFEEWQEHLNQQK